MAEKNGDSGIDDETESYSNRSVSSESSSMDAIVKSSSVAGSSSDKASDDGMASKKKFRTVVVAMAAEENSDKIEELVAVTAAAAAAAEEEEEGCCKSSSLSRGNGRTAAEVGEDFNKGSGLSSTKGAAEDGGGEEGKEVCDGEGKLRTRLCRTSSCRTEASEGNESHRSSSMSSCGGGLMMKPHKASNDRRWEAIWEMRRRDGGEIGFNEFRLLKRLGCGDIGSVYLAELRLDGVGDGGGRSMGNSSSSRSRCLFAMKVMDKASLAARKKLLRAQTEREILQSLDHPFLPSLYSHFETERFSCLVMEFCPGGDLHALRQRQPRKHFPESAARFYAAEVLLSLEYLHMMGVIYRDLKPENVLVREDGHIMLSDFDLSLQCVVRPTLVKSASSSVTDMEGTMTRRISAVYCAQPACLEPSCAKPSCFMPKVLPSLKTMIRKKGTKKATMTKTTVTQKSGADAGKQQARPLPELMVEPTGARSLSFVGTHEYLAPEIIKGEGHGSAVDWWTFGIFLYELLHGRTPFKGANNRSTLFNVIGQPLKFPSSPDSPAVSFAARDLIRGLLVKDPQHRLATVRGAAEIKQHPFFEGINWALIRSTTPPLVPRPFKLMEPPSSSSGASMAPPPTAASYLDFEFF